MVLLGAANRSRAAPLAKGAACRALKAFGAYPVAAAHQGLKAAKRGARERQLERMVPLRRYGDNRVRTYVSLTTPAGRFLQTPDAAGHGRSDLTLRIRAWLP
jgi:hypothetical protein